MSLKTEIAPYVDAFHARPREKDLPPWVTARREAALARFVELGFPTRRQEAWRFTNLTALQRTVFAPASGGTVPAAALDCYRFDGAGHRLVFVNGTYAPELSAPGDLPRGAWLASTARTLKERPDLAAAAVDESDTSGGQPFASLNAALFADGFVLALDPGVVLDRPVEIIHVGSADVPQSFHFRNLLSLGAGSRAIVIESHAGSGRYWTNAVSAVTLAEEAILRQVKLQDDGSEALHFAVTRSSLGKKARYDSFVLTLGARLSRHDLLATLVGEGAQLDLNGAYLLRGEQEATNATFVDHAAIGGTTRELYKGVVDGRAHGVFLGTVTVRPNAQQTDAQQTNKNLLLSRRASVDTKPQLEILADDVKCSHGATVGDLDESALFYLRARGIAEDEARRILIGGFAADALDTVGDAGLRAHLAGHVQRWLGTTSPSRQRGEGRGGGAAP
jgi:Fe-S cluster assembly protein SufD